jgi:hypothetical protein
VIGRACACMGPCPECGVCKCQCQCPKPATRSVEIMVYRKSDLTSNVVIPQPVAFFWTEEDARMWIGTRPTKERYDLEMMPVVVFEGGVQ